MRLPLLISVPHAGLRVPAEIAPFCALTAGEIAADGDVGAAEIYALEDRVLHYVTTPVARAIVDVNRAEDDRSRDGAVKTHTCWDVPVWHSPPPAELLQRLLASYHRPYHRRLSELAGCARLGVDCHTMAEAGPPVGPDPGRRRPLVCLGDGRGAACPRPWAEALLECLQRRFGPDVRLDEPFAGGHITRTHGREMPWVQLELSRTAAMSAADKRQAVLAALADWCALELPADPSWVPAPIGGQPGVV